VNIFFITDPLVTTAGAVRPAILLAEELEKHGYTTTLVSFSVSEEVEKIAEEHGIEVKSLNKEFYVMQTVPTFEAWARSLFRREMALPVDASDSDCVYINTSSCIKARSNVYYAQGPMTRALDDMLPEMPVLYRYAYHLAGSVLRYLDRKSIKDFSRLSELFIANSKFCASMYEEWDFKVDDMIPPPLDRRLFSPSTSRPSEGYVLTYFGVYSKETKFAVVESIARAGVKIKAFGGKTPQIPGYILKCPNIEFLGRVSSEKLVDLYSNALYTLFTFTHEPFGYIPIESMACGTPVLTYNKQGPSESVVSGSTGWLVNSDEDLFNLALRLWREGYPLSIRRNCRRRSSLFDVKNISERWINVIKNC